jgi:hypothetical protein
MLKRLLVLLVLVLVLGLWGCGDRLEAGIPNELTPKIAEPVVTPALTEVAVPSLIAELRKDLDQYQPQVKILSPQPGETINGTKVSIQLQVSELPIYKDAELGMGPHIHLFLDNQPYQAVYDASQPIVLENLAPGSHLIRAFASRPWHESFKNEGAYAESTFNVFTESKSNIPDFQQPLLTYSRPQGTYGAEPIMLDFYLTNAPLHFVAKEDETDNINDWRIRVTVNGESFILSDWQPIYLKGFKKGENWLKFEFIDDQGELLENVYNNPVRVINYDPKLNDTLAKLVQNKLPLRTAKRLVTTKELPPEPAPEIIEEVEVIPTDATPQAETLVLDEPIPAKEEDTSATVDLPKASEPELEVDSDATTATESTESLEGLDTTPETTLEVPGTDLQENTKTQEPIQLEENASEVPEDLDVPGSVEAETEATQPESESVEPTETSEPYGETEVEE